MIVDQLANTHLGPADPVDQLTNADGAPEVEQDCDAGEIKKIVRGNRVAIVYSTIRPWPWTRSYSTERLLFDPKFVDLIEKARHVELIRDYCEHVYLDLKVDNFMDIERDIKWKILFGNLKVRWIN